MDWTLLLFDLDGTLLRSDKTISPGNHAALDRCREAGALLGVCTSRGEPGVRLLLERLELRPDVLITSAGALARVGEEIVYQAGFSSEEVRTLLSAARALDGGVHDITADTVDRIYHSYAKSADPARVGGFRVDFSTFDRPALKICVEVGEEAKAQALAGTVPHCLAVRFVGEDWYKFTKDTATKSRAIRAVGEHMGLPLAHMVAFGDDLPDLDMLQVCGTGVAMGNAVPAVREAADLVIGDNDTDAIAHYLAGRFQLA